MSRTPPFVVHSHRLRTAAVAVIAGALIPSALEAQGRGRGQRGVPPGHLPSAGECRVWYDGRPPGQQPAPTDCGTARRQAYQTGGRVLDGGAPDGVRRGRRRDRDRDRGRLPDERYPDGRYPDGRYPDDRYPDGRYPDAGSSQGGSPTSLPEMVWGVLAGQGRQVPALRRWIGTGDMRVRYDDADGNGRPEAVSWFDPSGRIRQRWLDDDRDGRADRVALYQNGRVVRVIR